MFSVYPTHLKVDIVAKDEPHAKHQLRGDELYQQRTFSIIKIHSVVPPGKAKQRTSQPSMGALSLLCPSWVKENPIILFKKKEVLNWYLIPHISSRETTIMANMYRITNCPAGCISPLRSWSFFDDFYFHLQWGLIDGSPSRREAGRTGSNPLPVKIVNTGGSSTTVLGTGPLQSWVMH